MTPSNVERREGMELVIQRLSELHTDVREMRSAVWAIDQKFDGHVEKLHSRISDSEKECRDNCEALDLRVKPLEDLRSKGIAIVGTFSAIGAAISTAPLWSKKLLAFLKGD